MTTFMEPDDFDRFEDDGYTGYTGFGDEYTDAFYAGDQYDPDMYDDDFEMGLEDDE